MRAHPYQHSARLQLIAAGLKTLYNSFNVPYLQLKLAATQAQVKAVKADLLTVGVGDVLFLGGCDGCCFFL